MADIQRLDFIRREAPAFAARIHEAAAEAHNEAEFVRDLEQDIAKLAERLDVDFQNRKEYTLAYGRADAVYNRFIIEYEPPGSLRENLTHKHTQHAIGQVKAYISGLSEAEGHGPERVLGVAFDGRYFIYVRYHEGAFHTEPPQAVNAQTAQRFLTTLFSLSGERALIPENLVADFGGQDVTAKRAVAALYRALESPSPLAERLYAQWRLFFSEVAGFEAAGGQLRHKKELNALAKGVGVKAGELDAPRFFFALHSYFSFLVKLIARLALESVAGGAFGAAPLSKLAGLGREALQRELGQLEDGGLFRALGIRNLLEGDFFRWYLETFTPEVEEALKEIIGKLAEYNPATLQADPFATRDLLKALYHQLLPRPIRHDLGEYYTPDWLAERVITQLGEPLYRLAEGSPSASLDVHKRLLDPACGSGTFPVLALRARKENLRRSGLAEGDILEIALDSVVGIDLNPLAVLAARVNYLLALVELLPYRRGEIEIPVYLADSILTPAQGEGLFGADRRTFKTVVGELPIPAAIATPEALAKLTDLLEEYVTAEFSPGAFVNAADKALGLGASAQHVLTELYDKLLELHKKGLDGIWARIIKNAFMPLYLKDFDYVTGNPPWINWESLPAGYRTESAHLWQHYGLFVHSGMDTILGKGKKDISTLMTLVALDRYLKEGGKLAFVITQSVWKTAGAAQGFRQFQLPGERTFRVTLVEDLSSLQVFEGASTRTSVFVAQKGKPHRYPVPYTYWQKTQKGKGLGYTSSLEDVIGMTRRLNLSAQPVSKDDETSTWLTARKNAVKALREKVLGKSDYQAYEGVNSGGANAVYWLEIVGERPDGLLIVRNMTEGAKRKVEQATTAVEPDLLYPLLRGRDVRRWRAEPSAHVLMVQDAGTRRGTNEAALQEQQPKTYAYLKRFEKELRQRAAFKRYFTRKDKASGKTTDTGSFYSMFNVGEYTFAPWKIVWREQAAQMTAAVIGSIETHLVMPDHKLMLVPATTIDEAHYVCAAVNSSITRLAAIGYAVGIQLNTQYCRERQYSPL